MGVAAMDVVETLRRGFAGRYQIDRELGRGGMARVFLARDLRHDRLVAIKVLLPDYAAAIGSDRFLREIHTIAGFQHPHIIPLHDSGEVGGLLYYVMPYVEGGTLRDRLNAEGQLPIPDVLRIGREIAGALQYAHVHGVVHRDVKPENVLFSNGHALLSDFGISKASDGGSDAQRTETRWVVGTPAYMSPEQAAAADIVDGRSDTYSAACVLYEMLVGEPPFTGRDLESIIARHITEPPPSVRGRRHSVPVVLEGVLNKALEKSPADRYSSAAEFGAALERVARETDAGVRPPTLGRYAAAAAVGVALVIGTWLGVRAVRTPHLDENLYLVAPFAHREGAAPQLINGDVCELYLSRVMRSFSGISVVSSLLSAGVATDPSAGGHDAWISLARRRGSGRLIEGTVSQQGDTVRLVATLWNTRTRRQLQTADGRVVIGTRSLDDVFLELAANLLAVPLTEAGGPATLDVRAAAAFALGRQELATFELDQAEEHLTQAVRLDSTFAEAHLLLAQTRLWAGAPLNTIRHNAAAAQRLSTALGATDRRLAAALDALTQGQFPQACERFHALATADSTDVLAWIGLADCHRLDQGVVHDTGSPSGYRFRSSYNVAIAAYRQAIQRVPSFSRVFSRRTFEPLFDVLYVSPSELRYGEAVPPDTGRFRAYVGLDADTLAYVPHPMLTFASQPAPRSIAEAVARNRATFRELMDIWVRDAPESAEALTGLAHAYELLAQVDEARYGSESALATIRAARARVRTPDEDFEPAIDHVRLLIKAGRFSEGRALADSLLAAWPTPDPYRAHELAGIAALLGRPLAAARLAERAATQFRASPSPLAEVPLAALETRERLRVYAAIGAPADSIPVLAARVEDVLRRLGGAVATDFVSQELLDLPLWLAFPTNGMSRMHRATAPRAPLLETQWRFATGDTAAARARLAARASAAPGGRLGDVALSVAFQEAWLLVQLGDTTAAVDYLEAVIAPDVLPTLRFSLVTSPMEAAALARASALRAELAASAGDRATAAAYAQRVVDLWLLAEPALAPMVVRMRALAG